MATIRVDTSVLRKEADAIDRIGVLIHQLGARVQSACANVPRYDGQLSDPAKKASFETRARMDELGRYLTGLRKELLARADLFERAEKEIMDLVDSFALPPALTGVPPALPLPEIDNFQPFLFPQTRMVTLSGNLLLSGNPGRPPYFQKPVYHTGDFIGDIVGVYTDPKTKRLYYVVYMGEKDGKPLWGYVRATHLKKEYTLEEIPLRHGIFLNGLAILLSAAAAGNPWGIGGVPETWRHLHASAHHPQKRSGEAGSILDNWNTHGMAAQSMSITNMGLVDSKGKPIINNHHPNLCGPLSVLFAAGECDLAKGLQAFALLSLGEKTGADSLRLDCSTSGSDLQELFSALGWQSDVHRGEMPSPNDLASGLSEGKKFVFLTDLDTSKPPARLGAEGGHVAHWVTLTDVFRDENGKTWVQVYNPYGNQEEIYSWETFVGTCERPGKEGSRFVYLDASLEAAPPAPSQ